MSKIDSLYGAHAADPFVLRAAFSSVAEMIAAFKQGSQYTQVWYDEYCIIDTPNKNDKDNGIIYKRGYDYQNDMGGAIRIGQVVGPSSGTPYFAMDTIEEVTKISQEPLGENEYRRFPTGKDSTGKYITADNGTIGKFKFNTSNALVPGKSGATFNDDIVYTWCNVRKDNADADSWFYVGWEMPYLVEEFLVHDNSPYDASGSRLADATTIQQTDDKQHPFYQQWNIGLPHGIKGDAMRNMRVIVPVSGQKIYPWDALQINSSTGVATINKNYDNYPGFDDDVANKRQIIVFEYYAFDQRQNPEPYLIYMGDFNVVKNITVAEDGQITINYTHNNADKPTPKVTWVDSVSLTTTPGINGGWFTVKYNHTDKADFRVQLQWITDISIADNGTITYTYVGKAPVVENNKLRWITQANVDTSNGHFTIDFNNGNQFSTWLSWVKDIDIQDNGTIILHYTGNQNGDVTKELTTKLKNIVSATASSNGIVTFKYNTGETFTLKESAAGQDIDFKLKRVDNIILNTGIAENKRIQVKYNTENTTQLIGDPINYIQDMVVRPSDWHLLVLFNDPDHRYSATNILSGNWVQGSAMGSLSSSVKDPTNTLQEGIYWKDFGPIKDQAGILIGFNLTEAIVKGAGYQTVLDYLNAQLPNGLTGDQNELGGISTKGKIVAYSPAPTEKVPNPGCEFYAFDYRARGDGGWNWFYLGTIADNGVRDIAIAENRDTVSDIAQKQVNTKGVVLVENTVTLVDDLPAFWSDSYVG